MMMALPTANKSLFQGAGLSIFRRVFVYGTLKKGFGNHGTLMDAGGVLIAKGFIPDLGLWMWPTAIPFAAPKRGAVVFGEVWSIPEKNMAPIRQLEASYEEIELKVKLLNQVAAHVHCTLFVRSGIHDLSSVIVLPSGEYTETSRKEALEDFWHGIRDTA